MKRDNSLRKSSVIYINYMPRYTCWGIYIGEYIFGKNSFGRANYRIKYIPSRVDARSEPDSIRLEFMAMKNRVA